MRTTAFITFLAASFMLFIGTSAIVINKSQGEGSIQFDHGFASGQERRGMPEIRASRGPEDSCGKKGRCKPQLP